MAITRVSRAGPAARPKARVLAGKAVAQSALAESPEAIAERLRAYADAGVDTDLMRRIRAPRRGLRPQVRTDPRKGHGVGNPPR